MNIKRPAIAVSALTFEIGGATGEMQIFPAENFRARDGRPETCAAWQINATIAASIAARLSTRSTRLVIDYEHQTLNAEHNGQAAPAAGWWSGAVEWRDGVGMFATGVEWTARAAALIAAKEYLYVSPVFSYLADTGEILDIFHVAITNYPAVDGMQELALRAAARFTPISDEESPLKPETLAALLAAIGLKTGATDDQIVAAATALNTEVTQAKTEVAALKATAPDPTKFVPITVVQELQTQVAALTQQQTANRVDVLIEQARAAGKPLTEAMETHARATGLVSIDALTNLIAALPVVDALKGGTQTGGQPPGGALPATGGDPYREAAALAAKAQEYVSSEKAKGRSVSVAAAVAHIRTQAK